MLIISYVKRFKKLLILALIFATINQVFSLLDPYIFQFVVDDYITKAGEYVLSDFIKGLGLLLLAMMAVAFISRIAKNIQQYYVSSVSERVGTAMYADSVGHTFSLPYQVFEDRQSGEILQKMQKARDDTKKMIELFVGTFFISVVGILFVMIYLSTVHWSLVSLFFFIIPIFSYITYLISKKIKNAQAEIVRESAELAGQTTETIRNVELVKSLGLEDQEIRRLNVVNDKILDLELKKVKQIRVLEFLQGTSINALRMMLLFLAGYLVFQGVVSPGQFFTIMFYSFFIFGPLSQMGLVAAGYQEAKASTEQLAEVLSLPPEKKPENPTPLDEISSITFDDVSFQYDETPTLSNISLTVKKGTAVAFVGRSGSGKSTLVKLLVGLYKPQKGKILFNDVANDALDYEVLRKRIGFVAQETQLFAGTLRENLLFVNPKATDAQCKEVLQLAAVQHLLTRDRKGLSNKIGEGGIKLSGGEKQRLAIARALLRNPDIIIFDEATSSLDSMTEAEITKTIQNIAKHKPELIVIAIAHRLSTVEHSDEIFVLENGKVVEKGTHAQLRRKKAVYENLWKQQHS
jgi:ATP-binding cassette subfamily B protein